MASSCAVADCEERHRAKGFCSAHYHKWWKHGDALYQRPTPPPRAFNACSIEGCDTPAKARGWCSKHWTRWHQHGDPLFVTVRNVLPCSVDGCIKTSLARTYCPMHYKRWQTHGDPGKAESQFAKNGGPCTVDGCSNTSIHLTLCSTHYQRQLRNGDVNNPGKFFRITGTTQERLEGRLVEGPNDCHTFTGSTNPKGYARMTDDGTYKPVHRIAYELYTGPIPEGLEIDHLCRNRVCCNPDHLDPVTHKENLNRRSLTPREHLLLKTGGSQ